MSQPLDLLIFDRRRREITCAGKPDELVPELKSVQHLEETPAAVIRTRAALAKGVVFRMPRQLDHVLCKAEGLPHPADIHEITNQPLVVVGKVVDLVRQD